MVSLTIRTIDAAKKGSKDSFLWDDEVRGFGLKVTSGGRKIFILQYRLTGRGTPYRYTIGAYGALTPAQARDIASDLKHQIAKGIDPRAIKSEERAAAERQADPMNSVGGLIDGFAAKHLAGLKSGDNTLKLLNRVVRPAWGTRELARISRRDVISLLDDIEEDAGPYARNHATAAIRKMFSWATSRDPDLANPTLRLVMKPVTERDRVLSDGEIKNVWLATDSLISIFCPFAKLLLLTGQRRNEVARMSWAELGDLDQAVWRIPAERTKNGLPHDVPLSKTAVEILRRVPAIGPYVFTTDGETAISGFSKFKYSLDTAINAARRRAVSDSGGNPDSVKAMERWTFHDLRRTAVTVMAKRGVAPHVVEKLINHVSGTISGVAKIYNRHEYWEERKAAADLLDDYVKDVVGT
jgi:integrase